MREAELSLHRRIGADESAILAVQPHLGEHLSNLGDLTTAYVRESYTLEFVRIYGEEHEQTSSTSLQLRGVP